MPKVLRKYEHKDFSYLISNEHDDHSSVLQKIEKKPKKSISHGIVSDLEILHRKRVSQMDNIKLCYVKNTATGYVHDKACILVKEIPDNQYEMFQNIDGDTLLCKQCCKMAMLRMGIGDDFKHIRGYMNFFNRCHASNNTLHKLMLEYNAKLFLEDMNILRLHVNDDTWKLVITEQNELILQHNNYIILDDGTRYFTNGFHIQKTYSKLEIYPALFCIYNYSWQDHLDMIAMDNETNVEYDKIHSDIKPNKIKYLFTKIVSKAVNWFKNLINSKQE